MKSIKLFMVYYGKLPNYIKFWLECVKINHTIDFCLISDCIPDNLELPENTEVINISFNDFREKVQTKFDFKLNLNKYGRISQFRPALAFIFPEVVKGYDFWGYIECDLIFGNIRKFITDDILSNYDKIFKLGHFQIFKNNDRMVKLFMEQYKSALSYKFAFKKDILFFEELLGIHNIAESGGYKTYENNIFADLKCYELMFERSNYGYNSMDLSGKCLFSYDQGSLFMHILKNGIVETKEILYSHFQKRQLIIDTLNLHRYCIEPNKICNFHEIDKEYIESVINDLENEESSYNESMHKKLDRSKKDNLRKIDWWILRGKRFFIRLNHGYDLDGKDKK